MHPSALGGLTATLARILAFGRWAPAATAGLALAFYLNVGQFSRYLSDDYCSAAALKATGWLGVQASYFADWTGRYATTALVTSVQLLGPAALPSLIGLLLVGIALVIGAATRELLHARLPAAAAAGIVGVFLLVAAAPQPFQSIYWLWGAANYLPPILLGAVALTLGSRARRDHSGRSLVALAIVAFVGAGFSETSTALALAAGVVLVGVSARSRWRMIRPAAATFLFGSIAGAAIVILAPGNENRFAALPPPDLRTALLATPDVATAFVSRFLTDNVAVEVFVVLGAGVLAWGRHIPLLAPRWLIGATGAVFALVPAAIFPAIWATSSEPPDRALLYPAVLVLAWFAMLGWTLGSAATRVRVTLQPTVAGAAMLLLAIVPLLAFVELQAARPQLAGWAARQDELSVLLDAQHGGTVTVAWQPLEPRGLLVVGLRQPGADPSFWINGCLARLHGFDALIITK